MKSKQQHNECTPEPDSELGKSAELSKEGNQAASREMTKDEMETVPETATTQQVGIGQWRLTSYILVPTAVNFNNFNLYTYFLSNISTV